ncbi:MAG: hypothetical protein ACP5U0_09825 [Caldisphaera sp.]
MISKQFEFVDTNIVFDAIYQRKPFYDIFIKNLREKFLLKELCVTFSTVVEAQNLATKSAEFLSKMMHESVMACDWDNLNANEKDQIIKGLKENLEKNEEVKESNITNFITDALNLIAQPIQNLNKKEIILTLCPHLTYFYTRNLQEKISEHFCIPPVDGSHINYNGLLSTLKTLNNECLAFKLNENQDFDILSDLILLVNVGARYINNLTQDFDAIKFYSRDRNFIKNFNGFKAYVNNKDKKEKYVYMINTSLDKIEITNLLD